jgi:hypothetical protein
VRSLGQTSEQGTRAFREGTAEVEELRRLAGDVPPTAKPLRQFLESLDDDRRAIDEDPRALVGGPPADDPSNRNGGKGGFTGFEALYNFFFWSGMSINGFDDVGHLLRVSVTASEFCTPYENNTPASDPSVAEDIERCNQWLGPNQPGINAPDFTQGPQAAKLSRAAGKPAASVGERRAPGQPDAGPVPGQRDISKPQVTLPPGVQDLLDRLPSLQEPSPGKLDQLLGGDGPAGADGAPPSTDQLLDYLLAP